MPQVGALAWFLGGVPGGWLGDPLILTDSDHGSLRSHFRQALDSSSHRRQTVDSPRIRHEVGVTLPTAWQRWLRPFIVATVASRWIGKNSTWVCPPLGNVGYATMV